MGGCAVYLRGSGGTVTVSESADCGWVCCVSQGERWYGDGVRVG